MKRPLKLALGILGAALLSGAWIPALAAPTAPTAPNAASTKIKHVFVIVEEGHSFDNYFGTFPGADGIVPAKVQVPVDPRAAAGQSLGLHVIGAEGATSIAADLGAARAAFNGGRMNGFAAAQNANGKGAVAGLGYYSPEQVDSYWQLAKNYTLMDQFFSSAMGGSIDNHLYLVAGQAVPAAQLKSAGGYKIPTIFDRLDGAGLSWRAYIRHYDSTLNYHRVGSYASFIPQVVRVPMLNMPAIVDDPSRFSNLTDQSNLFRDLRSDATTPAVSYIYPSGDSERAPDPISLGQQRVTSIVTAIQRSPAWSSSAILVTWNSAEFLPRFAVEVVSLALAPAAGRFARLWIPGADAGDLAVRPPGFRRSYDLRFLLDPQVHRGDLRTCASDEPRREGDRHDRGVRFQPETCRAGRGRHADGECDEGHPGPHRGRLLWRVGSAGGNSGSTGGSHPAPQIPSGPVQWSRARPRGGRTWAPVRR